MGTRKINLRDQNSSNTLPVINKGSQYYECGECDHTSDVYSGIKRHIALEHANAEEMIVEEDATDGNEYTSFELFDGESWSVGKYW